MHAPAAAAARGQSWRSEAFIRSLLASILWPLARSLTCLPWPSIILAINNARAGGRSARNWSHRQLDDNSSRFVHLDASQIAPHSCSQTGTKPSEPQWGILFHAPPRRLSAWSSLSAQPSPAHCSRAQLCSIADCSARKRASLETNPID